MSEPNGLFYKTRSDSIFTLVNHYKGGRLNLEPGFQRSSVWNDRDRSKLIDSILRNYPLPAIFLYRRDKEGKSIYDVIDGKQRLEAIFRFLGVMRPMFATKTELPGSDKPERIDWPCLKRRKLQSKIESYEIPVIEVDGVIDDIISVFVRINSTGKPLTSQEKRHARYCKSEFLKEATKIASKFEGFFKDHKILTAGQISRMRHIELICEIMVSIDRESVLNKKAVLDSVMDKNGIDGRRLRKVAEKTVAMLNRLKKMFPDFHETRFRQIADFYTLIILLAEFERNKLILIDRNRNLIAWHLLKKFANSIDEVSEQQRKARNVEHLQEDARRYLLTVKEGTDTLLHRQQREGILRNLLQSVFETKDSQRGFTPEQRRLIWNKTEDRKCAHPGCKQKITWENFTIDHIKPHSRGGRSQLKNAAIMCRAHNSAHGNRRKRIIRKR